MKERENLHKERVNYLMSLCWKVVIGWYKLQLWIWLVDLNYNFECDWLTELSDNKLSDKKQLEKSLLVKNST